MEKANIEPWRLVWAMVVLIIGLAVIAALLWRWLKRSRDDPAWLVTKWLLSAVVIGCMLFKLVPWVMNGGYAGAFGMVFVAAFGLILAVIWTPNVAEFLARPFSDLYTGGSTPADPEPFYSIAQGHRKRGDHAAAIAEILSQLERFPRDVPGHLMLAEIQAECLKDLTAAAATVERLILQPGHHPRNIAHALNSLADWHLKVNDDVDSARQALERVMALLPDTEEAVWAAQRIGRLAAGMLEPEAPRRFVPGGVKSHVHPVATAGSATAADEDDPVLIAQKYVDHLAGHPLDAEVREKLALLYAERLGRLELAKMELEQMIAAPHQPHRQVVRWLNLLADLHIRCALDEAGAREALNRVIELFSGSAAAENAGRRLALLKTELQGRSQGRVIPIGSYEQNIGLKHGRPQRN